MKRISMLSKFGNLKLRSQATKKLFSWSKTEKKGWNQPWGLTRSFWGKKAML